MRLSRLLPLLATVLVFGTVSASVARAEVLIRVDKSAQIMTVTVDGSQRYAWPVSTGVSGHDTPSGDFKPFRMEAEHFSQEWDDAPMPHSIFFTQQGHAIHGSSHTKNLGRPASHGCVRLEPKNASILFALVKREHMSNTRVVLTGETPGSTGVPMARRGDQTIMAKEDLTGALPQPRQLRTAPGGWREIPNQRGYSDNDRFYAARRYYRDSYSDGYFPFGR
jgi:L,D-transpeptidase-like protein